MHDRVLYRLTWLAAALSLGHHLDHLIRGNAVGWPVTDQVNAFTASLVVYPVIAYQPPILGWLAFGWLVVFVTVLAITCVSETRVRWQQRQARHATQPASDTGHAMTATNSPLAAAGPPAARPQPSGPAAADGVGGAALLVGVRVGL